ncbi:C13 family peptidase [Desulfobacterales bacterium HSG17]|nr:C13 family peptidase [Desulfobacterales bacterium HSG17]
MNFLKKKKCFGFIIVYSILSLFYSLTFVGPGGKIIAQAAPPTVSNVNASPTIVYPGKDVLITCEIQDDDSSLSDSNDARIIAEGGTNLLGTINLFDDGEHSDGASGDGLYGGTWTTPLDMPENVFNYHIYAEDALGNGKLYENAGSFSTQMLYDDFEAAEIDSSKWTTFKERREIVNGKLHIALEGYDQQTNSRLYASEKESPYFEAKILIESDSYTQIISNSSPVARTSIIIEVDNYKISVQLRIENDNSISAVANITEIGTWVEVFWQRFSTSIAFDTEYTLSIEFVDTEVIFKCNEEQLSYQYGTLINLTGDIVKKIEATTLGENQWHGYINALFDDVYTTKGGTPYDDFETEMIDSAKWLDFEHSREIIDSSLRLTIRGIDERTTMLATPLISSTPFYIGAKVMIESGSDMGTGANGIARLEFFPYNNSRGPGSGLPYNEHEGNVWAGINLLIDENEHLTAKAYAESQDNADHSAATTLISEELSTPIYFDREYYLSIQRIGSELIFRCEDEVKKFPILTPIYPPSMNWQSLTTRVYADPGESGFIISRYDDVRISGSAYTDLVEINPSTLTVSEPEGSGTFNVSLKGNKPTANVILNLNTTNPEASLISPSTIIFTPDNWTTSQPVTITAVDDGLWDGDRIATIITESIISDDGYYTGFNPEDVSVTIQDDDTPPLSITGAYPNAGTVNDPMAVTLRGTQFADGMQVFIFRRDYSQPDTPIIGEKTEITLISVVNNTELTLTIPAQSEVGQYSLEAVKTGETPYELEGAVSFNQFKRFNKRAIIVGGGGPYPGNTLWDSTKLVTRKAYHALYAQGYSHDQIQFLTHEDSADIDGDGTNDKDGGATRSELEAAIGTWAKTPVPDTSNSQAPEEVLIFMSGHGGNGSFQIGIDEPLSSETLDEWIDELQTTIGCNVILIYDACISGSFLSQFLPPPDIESKRYVITSTAINQRAWFLNNGRHSFSYHFWESVFSKGYLYEAYAYGKTYMQYDQTAWIDINGDGNPDTIAQSLLDNDIIIGRGRVAASLPPSIGKLTISKETLGCENTVTITAENISTLNGVSSVFARLIPPEERQDKTKPITALPSRKLIDLEEPGVYKTTFDELNVDGFFRISVYAKDKSGFQSIPVQTGVKRECGGTSAVITGDINEDRNIDLEDMIIALKVLAGIDTAGEIRLNYVLAGVDVNGDNQVGLDEVIYALRRTAGL